MNESLLLSIAVTGFTVAFLHAAIPTHWLPFVLAARGQGWSVAKTLSVTAMAGSGHVLFTSVLGVLVVWLGLELNRWIGNVFPYIAGGALIAFGLFYLTRHARGGGHGHSHRSPAHEHHDHGGHHHDQGAHGHHHAPARHREPTSAVVRQETAQASSRPSDRAAIVSLFALLTFSPCEGFLPVYLSGISYGWTGFIFLSVVLAGATLAGMVLFTWLTLSGLQRFQLQGLERYENAMLGALLCILGILVIVLEQ